MDEEQTGKQAGEMTETLPSPSATVEVGLSAAIVTICNNQPVILCAGEQERSSSTEQSAGSVSTLSLPYGRFDPLKHRTLEAGLRLWVEAQTALRLGYVEQLYTFGDRGRAKSVTPSEDNHVISVGYLALTRLSCDRTKNDWQNWYEFLPWEDWRNGKPPLIDRLIVPALREWAQSDKRSHPAYDLHLLPRLTRLRLAFGTDGIDWDEERALERYELLYEAGLVREAVIDANLAPAPQLEELHRHTGQAMVFDHRRILATAIARLRAKLKYRPVIFEIMPDNFTLTALQETVEAISGRHLHKQNFRRLVENAELVEPTGASLSQQRGRPAALYRFRRAVLEERPAPGLRVTLN